MEKMRVYTAKRYGNPDVLKLESVSRPGTLGDNDVLVKVEGLSINPAELHAMKGRIWLVRLANGVFRPKYKTLSVDFSGVVVETGKLISLFRKGDKVFGRVNKDGLAEYIKADQFSIARVKGNIDLDEASSLPLVSTTALQALKIASNDKDLAHKRVLINGASGGIGTILTQLISHTNAEITAICSRKNFDEMANLGAKNLIDYKTVDVNQLNEQYDYIFDLIGNLKASRSYGQLSKKGKAVLVGYTSFWKTFGFIMSSFYINVFTEKKFIFFNAETKKEDLEDIMNLVDKGKIKPIIQKEFPFSHVVEAFQLLDTKRVRGKVVIKL